MFRFGEAIEHFKGLIESGAAGPVGLMSARYFCNSLHSPWWRKRDLSGGQLVEQVIHMVDLMRFLMGDAMTAYSRQENLFHRDVEDYTVEDVSATVFGFEAGC
jgi:predicted dehydrogenase